MANPKFKVGDTVKITKGIMKGAYGTIKLIANVGNVEMQRYNVELHSFSFNEDELQFIAARKGLF